jgi:sugar phosphate isomerase/epimerase
VYSHIGASVPPTVEAIDAAHNRLGLRFLELISPLEKNYLRVLKKAVNDFGINPMQVHAPTSSEADIGNFEEASRERALSIHEVQMRYASSVGVSFYVIHPGGLMYGFEDEETGIERLPSEKAFLEKVRTLNTTSLSRLAKFASKLDLKIALENGGTYDFHYPMVLRIVREVNHPNLGVCLDTGHANISRTAPVSEAIRKIGSLLWASHIHDNDGTRDSHQPLGQGNIDWNGVLQAFEDVSYSGMLSLELYRGKLNDDYWEGVQSSISLLKKMTGKQSGKILGSD